MPDKPAEQSGTATQTIRSLVHPERGRPLAGISTLTDEQLRQVVLWMREGKPNELIARTIKDYWGRCASVFQSELLNALYHFREKVFAKEIELTDEPELLFDPLAENASFVAELKEELRVWNEKAKDEEKPSKSVLEHIDRLGRLLADTIANHASIQVKLGKVVPADAPNNKPNIQIDKCQVIYNELSAPGMPDFLGAVSHALEEQARKKVLPGRKRATETKQ